ncbi:MAG: AbrB/MazE/SpoVT family DNA-binding domain-containing protein [Vallitaleaceae bacterium]|nr:AbrB/MazE/SpoVT family DNA-binding domain-containing protein [Vallitaleaceae bacterium]
MIATIKKWGNSQGIRLPKDLLETVKLSENDQVEITIENEWIIIKPLDKKHKTFEERVAEYSEDYMCSEWDTGDNKGKEV